MQKQHIFRIRRNYNKWVANQTLEDYALRFTAKKSRKWSHAQITNTALGAITFLALEALGGVLTLNYGFSNTALAVLIVGLIIFIAGIPVCYYAARYGVDIDLLTRGASFGYIGSTITSLIYASFTFIFFAIEAAIMAMAMKIAFGIPLYIGYFICAVLVIPLVTHGITYISKLQEWTQPVWIFVQTTVLIFVLYHEWGAISQWMQFEPHAASDGARFNLLHFGIASAVMFSLIAQLGEQVDFLRFLPPKETSPKRWYLALFSAGPGWIFIGVIKIFIGSFLAWLAFSHGLPASKASEPTYMYITAFSYMFDSNDIAVYLMGAFVILSQLKINVTNAYAGSIAWSNFFSRITHNHPGRIVWLVLNVVIALLLMEIGIYRVLENTLAIFGILAIAWIGSLFTDLVINKPLKLRPAEFEFKRAHLFDVNPVGVGSMLFASTFGVCAYVGLMGEVVYALAPFITFALTLIISPCIAWFTKGKYYIARPNIKNASAESELICCICEHSFEQEDTSYCTAYAGNICSLCCSLDARCRDSCKTKSSLNEQITSAFSFFFPKALLNNVNRLIGNFIALFGVLLALISALMICVYFLITAEIQTTDHAMVVSTLWEISVVLLIIVAVLCWIIVLVHESRSIAQDETRQQAERLQLEIEAHIETDKKLQRAKDHAEAANKAKSRYLGGISHELRSPLNAISGYAQLLEQEKIPAEKISESAGVIRRSSEHLADLIEGLLDMSKIEAGRLEIVYSELCLPILLEQLVSMFKPQAEAKGVKFNYINKDSFPNFVRTDEKRLRQILINILSNAVKFTHEGNINFSIKYRSGVAEFIIADTGVGIAPEDRERIFNPFERLHHPDRPNPSGTGLGLTITRLLVEILGGAITLESNGEHGSIFRIYIMLGSVYAPKTIAPAQQEIISLKGERKQLLVVDDDPNHIRLMTDILVPLGFTVQTAIDAKTCLTLLETYQADLLLMDVSMPGMNGFELAKLLREMRLSFPIIMISAEARENELFSQEFVPFNDYLVKPVNIPSLLEKIAQHLKIEWEYKSPLIHKQLVQTSDSKPSLPPEKSSALDPEIRQEFIELCEIGYSKKLIESLEEYEKDGRISSDFSLKIRPLIHAFQFEKVLKILREKTSCPL